MTNNLIIDYASMLNKDGKHCDFGWHQEINQSLYTKIKKFNKPYCLISRWCWWDLEVTEEEKSNLAAQSLYPAIIFSNHVVEDELGRYMPGHQCKTSLLEKFEERAFFETRNSLYVLIGDGTRKTVSPELAASLFWRS